MDAKTFAKIVQIVVQEEVTKIVKKELNAMKKQIVAEVKKSIPKQVIKETVYEHGQSQNAWEDMGMDIPDVLPQRKPKQQLVKDPVLNDILNETKGFGGENPYEEYPTLGGKQLNSNNAQGGNASQFRAMMAEKMGMTDMSQPGQPSLQEMLPETDPEGRPLRNKQVPDSVAKALTRDYSSLVKAMNKK